MVETGKLIKQEIASLDRNIFHPAWDGILRNEDPTLLARGGGKGLLIYEELERDPHCYAVLQKRKMAVVNRRWEVTAASEKRLDKKAADLVEVQLKSINFDHICLNLMDAILKGLSIGEILWQQNGDIIQAKEIRSRDQRRFTFDEKYNLRLLTQQNLWKGEPVPDRKFIVHSFGSKDANPFGLGLGSRLFFPVFFKRQGIAFWLTFCDKYGSPTALGTYPISATLEQQKKLLEALGAIAQDAGVIVPEGMNISFLEAARSGSIDTYEKLCRYFDEQISECTLGETLSTNIGSTGSYAASSVHNDVRLELAKADADLLSHTLNQTLIRWIIELNIPDANPPTVWRIFDEQEDLNSRVNRDKTLFDMGFKLKLDSVKEIYGDYYELAEDPNAAVTDQQFLTNSGIQNDNQQSQDNQDTQAQDQSFNEVQSSTHIADSVYGLVDQANSLKELGQEILNRYNSIDSSGFENYLAQSMIAAELAGRWEIEEESRSAIIPSFAEMIVGLFDSNEFNKLIGEVTMFNFSDLSETEYTKIGQEFVALCFAQFQLFQNDFNEDEETEFAESIGDSEMLLQLKQLLETNYQDGITAIRQVTIDGDNIEGIFEDKLSNTVTKRYRFTITADSINYKLENPNDVENADFSEEELLEFSGKTGKKGKTCSRGTGCGGSCISANKTCRMGMNPEQQKAHQRILYKAGRIETSLAKKRQKMKDTRGGALADSTIKNQKKQAKAQEIIAQAKAAKQKFEDAKTKVDLADKYYGKGKLSHEDAKTLGMKPGEQINYLKLEEFRKERDTAKAELDKFSQIKTTENFKAGQPLSDKQINKPLTKEEIDKIEQIGKLPKLKTAYGRGEAEFDPAYQTHLAYKKTKKEIPGLTPEEFMIARNYTKGNGYILPNSAARGFMEDPNSDNAKAGVTQARLIHSALGRLPDWKGEVRRDTRLSKSQFDRDYQVGKKVKFHGVTSTTSDLTGAATAAYGDAGKKQQSLAKAGFAGANKNEASKSATYDEVAKSLGVKTLPQEDTVNVEYRMNVNSGKSISKLSVAPKEAEIALRHGWTGKITNIEELPNGKKVVHLEED